MLCERRPRAVAAGLALAHKDLAASAAGVARTQKGLLPVEMSRDALMMPGQRALVQHLMLQLVAATNV